MINAFGDISAAGGRGGFDVVSGSIAEALYVTAAGIAVAVEAVVVFQFLNQRMARAAAELKMLTDEFLEALDETGPDPSANREPVDGADHNNHKEPSDGSRQAA